MECKIAIPKEHINSSEEDQIAIHNPKKIYVGGLPPNINENEMKNYFEQFGPLDQCVIMKDRPTGKPRGIYINSQVSVLFYIKMRVART